MTKEALKCDVCLQEMKENSEAIHTLIIESATETLTKLDEKVAQSVRNTSHKVDLKLATVDDKSTIFFAAQEAKIDKLISFVKWWLGTFIVIMLAFGGITGSAWVRIGDSEKTAAETYAKKTDVVFLMNNMYDMNNVSFPYREGMNELRRETMYARALKSFMNDVSRSGE